MKALRKAASILAIIALALGLAAVVAAANRDGFSAAHVDSTLVCELSPLFSGGCV